MRASSPKARLAWALAVWLGLVCAPRQMLKPELGDGAQWKELQDAFAPHPSFRATGKLTVQTASGQKSSASFGCAGMGDSLRRLDVHNPLGGTLLSLKLAFDRYHLRLPGHSQANQGTYCDTLFRPWLHLDLPLSVAKCLIGARPYIPRSYPDSSSVRGDTRVYYCTADTALQWELLVARQDGLPQKLIALNRDQKIFTIEWDRYRNRVPRRTRAVFPAKSSVILEFAEVYTNKGVSPRLFRFK